uniref:Ig-like domain-containing protein n=1 Tax=Catagonus wagneri TaxID=51154 RepID=A0A8C3W8Q6_9CETA
DPWMLLIYLFCFPSSADTRAETTLTQSPAFVSVVPGDKVNITCKASQDIDDDIMWYQQKPGEAPKLIIKYTSTLITGVPSRFSGSGGGTDFTLMIANMVSEDAAYYFCQQDDNGGVLEHSLWLTFGGGTKLQIKRADAKPSVFIFQPSKEQLETQTASVVCLINNFYPRDITVRWKVDGAAQSSGVLESVTEQDSSDNTYSLSSTLSLPTSEYLRHNTYSCEVTHKTLSPSLVKSINRNECEA